MIFQSSWRLLPRERMVVRTVLPTPIGSGEVSSSLSTLSSHGAVAGVGGEREHVVDRLGDLDLDPLVNTREPIH